MPQIRTWARPSAGAPEFSIRTEVLEPESVTVSVPLSAKVFGWLVCVFGASWTVTFISFWENATSRYPHRQIKRRDLGGG